MASNDGRVKVTLVSAWRLGGVGHVGFGFETRQLRRMLTPVKKPLRIGLRVLVALAVLLGIAAVMCLDGVDNRPYFHEAYYARTTAELRARAATNQLARGVLAAGFGRARLSPTLNAVRDVPEEGKFRSLPLAGYGGRHGQPARGVHDDLYVKAIALKVGDRLGVMVGADALIIPPAVADRAARRLAQESGLSREQIYLGATHSHSSLGGWGEGVVAEMFAGGFQPGAVVWFSDCIVLAVQNALRDLQPARFGHGVFSAPQFIRNRLVGPLGQVDPEFSFAIFRQEGGKLGVVGVFGGHATLLSSEMMEYSADYPGCWQRAVEEATGGTALFLAGGVGSHSAVPLGKGFDGADQMAQALARRLAEQLTQTALTNIVTFGAMGLDVAMPPLNVRVADSVRLRPWLAEKLLRPASHSYLQVFRLNDSVWISTPCDFSGELALGIKDFLHVRGSFATVTSFNGDYVGYVIPSRYYHLPGYEPRLMSFFGPNVPDYFNELIRTMALTLIEK